MKNPGKMILLFLLSVPLLAGVKVSVDKEQVTRGERVAFTLRITGEGQVKVPPLDELCGSTIEERMQSRRDLFSNGKRTQEISLIYTFMPQKSCVIDSFPVSVNGKEEMTEALNITVSKMSISKNEPFVLNLETDKKSFYVGEPFEMKVRFKERQNIDTIAESISLPESKNIWIKSENKGKAFAKEGYLNRENIYALSAQQSGKLTLGPLRWDVKVRSQSKDYWGTWLATSKTRSVFSNELDIDVKPLPDGISLVGDLKIEAHVDKMQINAGEAVNLTISVKGRANIEDIEPFEIHVEGAQAFNEEPKVTHFLQEEKYFGSFEQKSALVAQRDFLIPAFELRYMDVKTDKIKTIKSEPIKITLLNPAPSPKEELKISRPDDKPQELERGVQKGAFTLAQGAFLLFGGIVLGLIASMIPWKKFFRKEKIKHAVSAKESKAVLQLLMGNMHQDREIEELVQKLSENLYEGKSHEIDKKRLKEIVKELQKQ